MKSVRAWILAAACATACGAGPLVSYRVGPAVVSPPDRAGRDRTLDFATIFCATLTHVDPTHREWGACEDYLEARVAEQPPVATSLPATHRIVLVGGLFSHCFDNKGVRLYELAAEHLRTVHGLSVDLVPIGGVSSPEANAALLDQNFRDHPGPAIAIGHSKGAVDLMTALQVSPNARSHITALVSVAGAVYGSRLVDLGPAAVVLGFQTAVRQSGLGSCTIKDEGAIQSLNRATRYQFAREWTPPPTLRRFSLVGVVDEPHTSSVLRVMRNRLALYSQDQDSQVIADEGVLPGADFLGVAKGDHWALAVPFSDQTDPHIRNAVDHNTFPRVALLEALVRFVYANP
jgi:hypothetical protein